jgi:hypothetical protein
MKSAEALLGELVEHVRPPKGCPIKLKEWPANHLTLRNWIAIRGDMADLERERFDKKVVQLRQTDPQVDWSAINEREDSRRVILYIERESGPKRSLFN